MFMLLNYSLNHFHLRLGVIFLNKNIIWFTPNWRGLEEDGEHRVSGTIAIRHSRNHEIDQSSWRVKHCVLVQSISPFLWHRLLFPKVKCRSCCSYKHSVLNKTAMLGTIWLKSIPLPKMATMALLSYSTAGTFWSSASSGAQTAFLNKHLSHLTRKRTRATQTPTLTQQRCFFFLSKFSIGPDLSRTLSPVPSADAAATAATAGPRAKALPRMGSSSAEKDVGVYGRDTAFEASST